MSEPTIPGVTPQSDLLAWLNVEQQKAARWGRSDAGIYRFQLTGPELMRIRHALGATSSEWQCRYVAEDQRCCVRPHGHEGEHTFHKEPPGDPR